MGVLSKTFDCIAGRTHNSTDTKRPIQATKASSTDRVPPFSIDGHDTGEFCFRFIVWFMIAFVLFVMLLYLLENICEIG